MCVGLLLVECFIPESLSLKDKRRVLLSVSDRLRREFNVAVAETDYQDQWQRAALAIVSVNTEWRMLQGTMSRVGELLERERRLLVTSTEVRQLG
jgi:uncharacterized protein YlxP (DUF503 family)